MTITTNERFNQIGLAWDIHEVVAVKENDRISAPLFKEYGMVVQVPVKGHDQPIRHYIYPFVKEFFQLLTKTPGVQIGFFTSSERIFAEPFVKQLLTNALGDKDYAEVAAKVTVCARDQLKPARAYSHIRAQIDYNRGIYRKDLDVVFANSEIDKKQRLLIDDDQSYAAPHQIENLVSVSGHDWVKKLLDYELFGYELYFFSSREELKSATWFNPLKRLIGCYSERLLDGEEAQTVYVIVYQSKEKEEELRLSVEESKIIEKLYTKSFFEQEIYIGEMQDDQKLMIDELRNKVGIKEVKDLKQLEKLCICGKEVSAQSCIKKAEKGLVIHLREGDDADIYLPEKPQEAISLKENGLTSVIQCARDDWFDGCMIKNYFTKNKSKEVSVKNQQVFWR